MRIFVTGATGFVGSAVVRELHAAGHQVLGLARSDTSAESLTAAGAQVHRGTLQDLESLRRGAAAADGVIHTAFIHDFANFAASAVVDQRAIEALSEALSGTGKPLVVTSGCLGLQTERDSPPAEFPRKSEPAVLAAADRGVRTVVVRLPPSVHGEGESGFVPVLIESAREHSEAIYVGEGETVWPAVHRLDAARLFVLALEQGSSGATFHGVAEEGVSIRAIAESIGRRLGVPAVSKTPEEAVARLGFLGNLLTMGGPSSSAWTQECLGWRPQQPGLLTDLAQGHYFDR